MSRKIAPTLQRFFGGERNPFRNPEEDAALRAELRALLAVARAVRSWADAPCPHDLTGVEVKMLRALARLDRVSGREP